MGYTAQWIVVETEERSAGDLVPRPTAPDQIGSTQQQECSQWYSGKGDVRNFGAAHLGQGDFFLLRRFCNLNLELGLNLCGR